MKILLILTILATLNACQLISPLFVDYNGVRRDVAKWINQQSLLNMQQKRSLAQLSKAQQKISLIEHITHDEKIIISKENAIAMYCAQLNLSNQKIEQLQTQIFGKVEKKFILESFEQNFPKLKLDASSIQCD